MTYSNVAKHNGESYDLRTNYQSKVTEVFPEPSKYLGIYFIDNMNKIKLN